MTRLITIANKHKKINSLIHVGGHKGQEIEFYKNLKLRKVIIFEPINSFANEIRKKIEFLENFELYQVALGDEDTVSEIYIADEVNGDTSGSSSILKPRKSKITFSTKEKITIKKLSSLDIGNIDCAVLDTQGYELRVLKGFEDKINDLKFIITEFSTVEGYIGRVLYKDLNIFLNKNNFYMLSQEKKVAKLIKNNKIGSYGDALYVNGDIIPGIFRILLKIKYKCINNIFGEVVNYFSNINNYKKLIKKVLVYPKVF